MFVNLDSHQQIGWFHVTVNDSLRMHVIDGRRGLINRLKD